METSTPGITAAVADAVDAIAAPMIAAVPIAAAASAVSPVSGVAADIIICPHNRHYRTPRSGVRQVRLGVLAGGATFAIGQIAFATVRTPLVRVLIGLLYAVPAGIAGYQASLGLAEIGVPSEGWREAFAIVGAVLVGATAFARMGLLVPPPTGQRIAEAPASPSLAGASRDG